MRRGAYVKRIVNSFEYLSSFCSLKSCKHRKSHHNFSKKMQWELINIFKLNKLFYNSNAQRIWCDVLIWFPRQKTIEKRIDRKLHTTFSTWNKNKTQIHLNKTLINALRFRICFSKLMSKVYTWAHNFRCTPCNILPNNSTVPWFTVSITKIEWDWDDGWL